MLSTKDAAIVYDTLLSSPGMSDSVKVSILLSRKNVLLLAKLIEFGLSAKDGLAQSGILSMVNEETITALSGVSAELLKKASLNELNDRLSALKQ